MCSPGALEQQRVRDAKTPTVDEFEPGVPTCSNCYTEAIDRYPCECWDTSPHPDDEMLRDGLELVRTTTQVRGGSVTTEQWRVRCSCVPRCDGWFCERSEALR